MGKQIRVSVAVVLAFGWLHAAAIGQEAQGKCFLWKVTSKKATVYLLGSIHMCDASMYPLDPTIEDAFNNSDALVLEIDLSPASQMKASGLMMQKALFAPPQTLETSLSKKALTALRACLKERGMPLAQMNQFRPWFVALLLTMQECTKFGYTPTLGVDKHFYDKAMALKKPVLALETVEEQVNILSGGSKDEQDFLLLDTLNQLHKTKDLMDSMLKAWLAGDADGLDKIIAENVSSPKLKAYQKRVFDDRNARMAKKVREYLKTKKTYFVVVGAGHLVGKMGIPSLLQKKRCKVEQLNKTGKAAAPAKAG